MEPRRTAMFRTISRNVGRFVQFFEDEGSAQDDGGEGCVVGSEGAGGLTAMGGYEDQGDVPKAFQCPITCELLADPVIAADGHTYERDAIGAWLAVRASSPMCAPSPFTYQMFSHIS